MRILIVEDDIVSSTMLTSIMSQYGTTVSLDSGTAVLPAFEKAHSEGTPFSLICLDIMLPGLDGQSILKQIRSWEATHGLLGLDGVKILMMTALSDRFNIMEAFRAQCEGYIVKPISKSKVVEQLISLGCISA